MTIRIPGFAAGKKTPNLGQKHETKMDKLLPLKEIHNLALIYAIMQGYVFFIFMVPTALSASFRQTHGLVETFIRYL